MSKKLREMFGGKKEEVKPERDVATIQGEYQNLCVRAGHLQYQIVTLQKDLEALNGTLRDLNFEAAKAHAKAQKEKAAETPAEGEKSSG